MDFMESIHMGSM